MPPKHEIIIADYQGFSVSFTDDGWFDATAAAAKYGKRPNDWLALPATKEYLGALDEESNTGKSGNWVRVTRGKTGGTWLHPDLAVQFARWLDVKFAIWCDRQIRSLLVGTHPHFDRLRLRHEAAASFKVMTQILQLTRESQGKTSAPHHAYVRRRQRRLGAFIRDLQSRTGLHVHRVERGTSTVYEGDESWLRHSRSLMSCS